MAKVICTLPNVTSPINDVPFTEDRGQWISDDISDDVAANFCQIPGYELVKEKKAKVPDETKPPAET